MSNKHTAKKDRSRSRYRERLSARGLSKSPTMPSVEDLRARQRHADWKPSLPK